LVEALRLHILTPANEIGSVSHVSSEQRRHYARQSVTYTCQVPVGSGRSSSHPESVVIRIDHAHMIRQGWMTGIASPPETAAAAAQLEHPTASSKEQRTQQKLHQPCGTTNFQPIVHQSKVRTSRFFKRRKEWRRRPTTTIIPIVKKSPLTIITHGCSSSSSNHLLSYQNVVVRRRKPIIYLQQQQRRRLGRRQCPTKRNQMPFPHRRLWPLWRPRQGQQRTRRRRRVVTPPLPCPCRHLH